MPCWTYHDKNWCYWPLVTKISLLTLTASSLTLPSLRPHISSSSNHHYIFPSVVWCPHKTIMDLSKVGLLVSCTFLFAYIASPLYTVVLFFLWQTLCKIFFNKQACQLHRAGQYHFLQGSRYCCSGILFHYSPELQDLYHLVNMCTWNSHSTLATCCLYV